MTKDIMNVIQIDDELDAEYEAAMMKNQKIIIIVLNKYFKK